MQAVKNSKDKWHHFSGELLEKNKRFVVTVKPGAQSKHASIPISVFLRDTLKIVTSLREAKSVIYSGKIKVDGVIRKSLHHGAGLNGCDRIRRCQ